MGVIIGGAVGGLLVVLLVIYAVYKMNNNDNGLLGCAIRDVNELTREAQQRRRAQEKGGGPKDNY